jgi:hypothetical protein
MKTSSRKRYTGAPRVFVRLVHIDVEQANVIASRHCSFLLLLAKLSLVRRNVRVE